MILLRKPSPRAIQGFLQTQAGLALTYPAVGATAGVPPAGYAVDHARVRLGEGEAVFAAARAALARWEHFRLGWAEAWPAEVPLREGQTVAVLARILGLWWLNACRIVYVVERQRPNPAFGFAYGTLPAHAESGEERFLVECDPEGGGVWYDILAFSRPRHLLARLGYPLARRRQERFRTDSAAAMQRAVAAAPG
jgi:uncharacterized protein (UPF0548 family)